MNPQAPDATFDPQSASLTELFNYFLTFRARFLNAGLSPSQYEFGMLNLNRLDRSKFFKALQRTDGGWPNSVNSLYEKGFLESDLKTMDGAAIDIGDYFFGWGWAPRRHDIHGDTWLELGPANVSCIGLYLSPNRDHVLHVEVHAAPDEPYRNVLLLVNGRRQAWAGMYNLQRSTWLKVFLNKDELMKNGGRTVVTFALEEGAPKEWVFSIASGWIESLTPENPNVPPHQPENFLLRLRRTWGRISPFRD